MASLEFPLTAITDRGLHVNVTIAADALKPAEVPALPLDEVTVRGTLSPLIGQFLFQGTVEGVFVHACDRCLEDAGFPVSLPVVWTFEEGAPRDYLQQQVAEAEAGDEEEVEALGVFTYQGISLDLSRPVWDEIALALPAKYICREGCRGLCPVCGGNRNTAPCTCEENLTGDETPANNSGFAGLKDLFPDLPE